MKSIVLFLTILGSVQAYAGQSTILAKTEVIEVSNPTAAFGCHPGDGGFIFPTLSLNTHLIPREFGGNMEEGTGLTAYLPTQDGQASCKEAMRIIDEEIKKQGGQLKVEASRSLARWAYYDNGCQLLLAENVEVKVGSLVLSGVATSFVKELPELSYRACNDLVPDPI